MKITFSKIISIILIVSFALSTLAACKVHEHEFSKSLARDENTHWSFCECGQVSEKQAHTGGESTCTEKAKCEICNAEYGELKPHNFEWYKKNEDSHWHFCSDCQATGQPDVHNFTFVTYYDASYHWLQCICGQKQGRIEHELVNLVCFCGYKAPGWDHVHSFDTLRFDYDGHWYECECMEVTEKVTHTGGNATCTTYAECEVCTISYGELANHEYNIVRITENEHTYECVCGKSQDAVAHNLSSGVCECGYESQAGHVHEFNIPRYNNASHWYECDCKVSSAYEAHTGGNATCEKKAVCEICQQSYGEISHKWNNGELTVPSTIDKTGIITYTCSDCKEKRPEVLAMGTDVTTRRDLEAGIAEVAWSYYLKGVKMQYDSISLSAISNHYGGTCRHTRNVSPEFGTSDTTIYSVCTGFPTKVYYEAINRNLWESKVTPNGIITMWHWLASDNQAEEGFANYYDTTPDPITENDRDLAIARWIDYEKYIVDEEGELKYANALGTFESSAFVDWCEDGALEFVKDEATGTYSYYLDGEMVTPDKVKLLLRAYLVEKENGDYVHLRPGDLFTEDTHTLLYVGYGYVLDCSGEKYNISSGVDSVEKNGAIFNRHTVEEVLMKRCTSDYVLTRPLDYYATDYDGNPGNDIIKFDGESIELSEATLSRIEYPAMEIDRTVDITPYGTAEKDGTVTYSIKISNKTNESKYRSWKRNYIAGYVGEAYENLLVTETISEGTEFVSASEGYTLENGILSWNIDVAVGECVEITYTVKVTAEVGSTIISGSGMVAGIPSNSISNKVGYSKLDSAQIEILNEIINSSCENWDTLYGTDLDFAEGIYKAMGANIELPSLEVLIEKLFTPTYFEKIYSMNIFYKDKETPIVMYVPQAEVSDEYKIVHEMLVDRYFGGYRMFSADVEKFLEVGIMDYDFHEELDKMILEFSFDYLEVGDILVYATANDRSNTDMTSELSSYRILIYAGNETFIEMNESGVGAIYSDADAKQIISSSFKKTNDLFFLLRPSEAVEVGGND